MYVRGVHVWVWVCVCMCMWVGVHVGVGGFCSNIPMLGMHWLLPWYICCSSLMG